MENDKNINLRTLIIVAVCVFAALIILILAICAGYLIMRGKDNQKVIDNPVIDASYVTLSDQKLSNGAIPDNYRQGVKQVEINGVGTKTSVIDQLRRNTDQNLQSLERQDETDAVYYSLDGEIMRIDIASGTNGFQYNRSYYFNSGILYFALIYQNGVQSSAYYFDDVMYRYITEDGQIMFNAFNDKQYMAVAKLTINEAYSFYNHRVNK